MEFTIEKDIFAKALAKIQGITSRNTSLQITECVLIESTNDTIRIEATDLETGFSGEYPTANSVPGAIVVNCKKLYEIVKAFPEDTITVQEKGNRQINIKSDNIGYRLIGVDQDGFPEMPDFENVEFFVVRASDFQNILRKADIAKPNDSRIHVLSALFENYISPDGKKFLRSVSTDGARLVLADCPILKGDGINSDRAVLAPKKGLSKVCKALDREGITRVGIAGAYLVVENSYERFGIRLMVGDFPRYESLLDWKESGKSFTFDKMAFLDCIKRSEILTAIELPGIKLRFGNNTLEVATSNPEFGESKEIVDIEYYGEPVELNLNGRYLSEIVAAVDADSVEVCVSAPDRPCFVNGADDPKYQAILMPQIR